MLETNTRKILRRLLKERWITKGVGDHDVFKHPDKQGRIQVPRHREVSIGVARSIAKIAGWLDEDRK